MQTLLHERAQQNFNAGATAGSPLPQGREPMLDGLKGILCLIVVYYHSIWLAGAIAWRQTHFDGFMPAALLGAHDVFSSLVMELWFLLSGYLLFLPLVLDQSTAVKALPLRAYAIRRLRRIYPPYIVALIFTCSVEVVCGCINGLGCRWYVHPVECFFSHVFMLQIFSKHCVSSICPAYWSLPVEEQFYVTLPLLVFCARRYSLVRALSIPFVVAIILRVVLQLVVPDQVGTLSLANHLGFTRLVSFVTGMFVASLVTGKLKCPVLDRATVLTVGTLLFLPLGIAGSFIKVAWCILPLFWSVGYGCLLLLCLRNSGKLRAFLTIPSLTFFGRVSYSWYLTHWAVLLYVATVMVRPPHVSFPAVWLAFLIGPPLSCLVGYIFFRLVESPWMRSNTTRTGPSEAGLMALPNQ